jgi:hypothetical protein
MRTRLRSSLLISQILLLGGCTPAVYLNLYNATEDALTVIKPHLRRVITIEPYTTADVPLVYVPRERVMIHGDRHSWTYSPRSLFPPHSMYQQHTGVMRAFGRIDSHGHIYLLAPPSDHNLPHDTPQPAGFPVKPQKT